MTLSRRTFLVTGIAGVAAALTACTPPAPTPSAGPVTPAPIPSLAAPRMPAPTAFHRSNWLADPYSRGSRTFMRTGSHPALADVLQADVDGRIFLAGDATQTAANGSGTVAGALRSGDRVAGQVLLKSTGGERIAIIGAGIAGATAASALVRAGLDVIVFEARDRVGGRIRTVDDPDWAVPLELGASVTPVDPVDPATAALRRAGVRTESLPGPDLLRSAAGAELAPSRIGQAAVREAHAWAVAGHRDVSLASALLLSGAVLAAEAAAASTPPRPTVTDDDLVQYFLDTALADSTGADARQLSALHGLPAQLLADPGPAPSAAPEPGGTTGTRAGEMIVLGGYDTIVRRALTDVDVSLSSVVTQVNRTTDGVGIRLITGESLQVDRVIVTVPLGVLQSGDLLFDPPLPTAHRRAIQTIGMGANDTLWLRYEEPFWATDATKWSLVDDTGTFGFLEWRNLLPVTGEPILVGITGADRARRLSTAGDSDVLQEATASLAALLSP